MAYPRSAVSLATRIETVQQEQFGAFIASTPFVILKVGTDDPSSFLSDVRQYFQAEYGTRVRLGHLNRWRAAAYPMWSLKHFGRVFANLAIQPSEAPDGYYLFIDGTVAGFHPGTSLDGETDLKVAGFALLLSFAFDSSAPLHALDKKSAEKVVTFFEGIIRANVQKSAEGTRPQAKTTVNDPHAVLDVLPSASDAEITAARNEQLRLNHPDLVARMSLAIQAVAHERTKAINAAYTMIIEKRRSSRKR